MISKLALLAALAVIVTARIKPINIGIFLDDDEQYNMSMTAITSAVSTTNLYKLSGRYEIIPNIYKIKSKDLFETDHIVCELLQKGVAAIFGPESPEINEIIQSVSSSLEIPQFQTFWNPKLASFSSEMESDKPRQVFNMYPSSYNLSIALATLVRINAWKSYTILYENDDGLIRLQETLKQRNPTDPVVSYRKLVPGRDQRSVLKALKSSGDLQIILDCQTDHVLDILRQARQLKLLEEYHSYFILNLDAHTLDWSEFKYVKSNITAIRLIDPKSVSVRNTVKDWELLHTYDVNKDYVRIDPNFMRTKTALLYDAINLFITVFAEVDEYQDTLLLEPLNCEEATPSFHGQLLAEKLKAKELREGEGLLRGPLTGVIKPFDEFGQRHSYQLQIIELIRTGDEFAFHSDFRVLATWDSEFPNDIRSLLSTAQRQKEFAKQIQQKNFKVVSRIGAPYLMRRLDKFGYPVANTGNERFEGYAIDLIDHICKYLNCSYTFELVPDGHYGSYDPETREWNGLIGHLLARKADLAICDLTITYERRKAVDFTMPFMTLGISILYAKAVKEPPELLSFSHPLSLDVWLYMATAYLVISMIIFLVARLNPREWENPHPCDPNPQELENIWSIRNCCWLTLGSIMAQGCDILPKGISTRLVAGMWWFFSLIMTACYTANLAAFLTNERMGPTIESAEDLASQTKIKYGCLAGGSTSSFFKDTNFSTYHRMWVQMESADPSVFEKNNDDGVKRVLSSKRKYAFLMESSSIEYEMERNCELTQVGGLLDSKGYGIAMPTNAIYRKSINEAILKMQEAGTLTRLKDKWWKEMNGGGQCTEDKHLEVATASELGLDHVGGVFVVLLVGTLVSLLIAVFEFLWNVRKIAVDQQMTLKAAFESELKFAMNIWARKKMVKSSREMSLEKIDS